MRFLISGTHAASTATEAALAAGFPKWDFAQAASQLNALEPGDQLRIRNVTVIRVTGVIKDFIE